jgi:hypothetical protein
MNEDFSSVRQKQMDNVLQYIKEAGEKNIAEKRKSFEHLTLLISTILGFSAGLIMATGGEPEFWLVFSWFFDVLTIVIGSTYLILEEESRYYRTFIAAEKQLELTQAIEKADTAHFNEVTKGVFLDIHRRLFDIKAGKTFKEKLFIAFARYQTRIEILFYLTFLFSLILLTISFI